MYGLDGRHGADEPGLHLVPGVTLNALGEPDSRFGLVLEVPAERGVEVVLT